MRKPPLILTPGDPASISPELTVKAAHHLGGEFVAIGAPNHLAAEAAKLNLPLRIEEWQPGQPIAKEGLSVLPVEWATMPVAGQPDPRNAAMVIEAIKQAADLCHAGQAAAMITNPIAKSILYEAGFTHPGHTEFLADLDGSGALPLMMIANDQLRVVPFTIHEPLASVPDMITEDGLITTLSALDKSMRLDFGLQQPRLAVCGLNPHAGEGGHMGREEQDIIIPALNQLRAKGLDVSGPWPADTLFTPEARANYDVVIGMYHDQVLIPAKTLDFHNSVNITLNLGFVRTSPDHGTAFDIAGKGIARADSLIAALRMARLMADNRQAK